MRFGIVLLHLLVFLAGAVWPYWAWLALFFGGPEPSLISDMYWSTAMTSFIPVGVGSVIVVLLPISRQLKATLILTYSATFVVTAVYFFIRMFLVKP